MVRRHPTTGISETNRRIEREEEQKRRKEQGVRPRKRGRGK